jgi:hypothetical protein
MANPVYVDSTVADTSYLVSTPLDDSVYAWQVKGGNSNGWGPYSELWSFTVDASASAGEPVNIPSVFRLHQNIPNPFNPATRLSFNISENSDAIIEIYNVLGQKVDKIELNSLSPGEHTVVWDGTGFPSGVYFYRLTAGDRFEIRKMTLLK